MPYLRAHATHASRSTWAMQGRRWCNSRGFDGRVGRQKRQMALRLFGLGGDGDGLIVAQQVIKCSWPWALMRKWLLDVEIRLRPAKTCCCWAAGFDHCVLHRQSARGAVHPAGKELCNTTWRLRLAGVCRAPKSRPFRFKVGVNPGVAFFEPRQVGCGYANTLAAFAWNFNRHIRIERIHSKKNDFFVKR